LGIRVASTHPQKIPTIIFAATSYPSATCHPLNPYKASMSSPYRHNPPAIKAVRARYAIIAPIGQPSKTQNMEKLISGTLSFSTNISGLKHKNAMTPTARETKPKNSSA